MTPRNKAFWKNVIDSTLHEKYECKRIMSNVIYEINGIEELARFMHFIRKRRYIHDPFVIVEDSRNQLGNFIEIGRTIYANVYTEKWDLKANSRILELSNEWVQLPNYKHAKLSELIDYKKEFRGHKLKNYGL